MKADTRQGIIEAAISVFNGDLSAPLERVAQEAGITRRTLHRYFRDRDELLAACNRYMVLACREAMEEASRKASGPLQLLEYQLYAAIDCGVKYAFLRQIHRARDHHHTHSDKNCEDYDRTFRSFNRVIEELRDKGEISNHLPSSWIAVLFPGIVSAAISSLKDEGMREKEVKKFAWISMKKAIGN
ncbi:TetR/AcrR family transcriptional regulator [Sinomicrobium soli]|uniref:TetR/AcrR family transcriptional regulator n=1 Tax=Sinomicrobium sp. N-1-3-6 TaxID=2219864 RepID=UPI001374DD8C|nr:TetR/AcrR family transcriptional regulator [Sinomicrobium sp. N-1-3-6]